MVGKKINSEKHRRAELDAAFIKRDVLDMLDMIASGERDRDNMPPPPNPKDDYDLDQWRLSMQAWKAAVKNFIY